MKNLFAKLLLSDKVATEFYNEYKNNINFKKWIDENLPELNDCENQQQNNPWHKYNVLGHILHSVEEMNKLSKDLKESERLLLAITMLFHDIGKPSSHIARIKDGKMIDSFFNHNIKSSEIASRRLEELGFCDQQIKIIKTLVFKHDIFMFIKPFKTQNPHWKTLNEKLIEDELNDLSEVGDGTKLLKYLLMVGRADNLAQNEKMTGDSLALLDQFETMFNSYIEKTKILPFSNY